MMQRRLIELHQQRGRLQERIAQQRAGLAQQLAPIQSLWARGQGLAAAGREGLAWLRAHPVGVGAAVLALVLLRPRFALRWVGRGIGLWRTWKLVRRWVPAFAFDWLRRRF